MIGLLVIRICIYLESIEGFNANVDVLGKAMNNAKALEGEVPPLSSNVKPTCLSSTKDGMHDPVLLFNESRIIDFFAVGNSLDKSLEIVALVQKGLKRHVATSP